LTGSVKVKVEFTPTPEYWQVLEGMLAFLLGMITAVIIACLHDDAQRRKKRLRRTGRCAMGTTVDKAGGRRPEVQERWD